MPYHSAGAGQTEVGVPNPTGSDECLSKDNIDDFDTLEKAKSFSVMYTYTGFDVI